MAYNWAQLAFVEKWRLKGVRGQIVGMYRPADRTFFDLRLRPGEGGAGQIPGPLELHLQDAGDMIREKKIGLLDRATVVVRVVASPLAEPGPAQPTTPRGRRWLEAGSTLSGTLTSLEQDEGILDVGFPVVLQLTHDASAANLRPGQTAEVTISETPKGFLVI